MESTISYYTPTGKEDESIEVYVFYRLGGTSWSTHEQEKRGMCLMVHPVELKDGFKRFAAYSGFKSLLKEMKRKNKKEMAYAEEWVKENHEKIARDFMAGDVDWDTINSYGK